MLACLCPPPPPPQTHLTPLQPDPSFGHKRRDSCKHWYNKAAANLKAALSETVNAQGDGYYHEHHPRRDDYDNQYNRHYEGGDDGWYHNHYGWDHHRYNEHYSCGRDEAEGASPHLVLVMRGSVGPGDWTLGE